MKEDKEEKSNRKREKTQHSEPVHIKEILPDVMGKIFSRAIRVRFGLERSTR